MSYHIQKQEKETQKLNFFFFSHPKRSFYTPAEMCPAHLAAAGCTAWMKIQEGPFGDQFFSLLVTVISDKLDHLIE